jgi:hypothetical protein
MQIFSILLSAVVLFQLTAHAQLRINEFVTDNDGSLLDEDGDASDWIEIHNPGGVATSLTGKFLTDDADEPAKWAFPDIAIPPGGYLLVFASGKDRRIAGNELHTNFSLASGGEYLALTGNDGITPLSSFSPEYPQQVSGVSYGTGSATNPVTESQTLVTWPADARWFIPVADIGDSWQLNGFDDAGWTAALTGIGFGYSFPGFIGTGGNTLTAMRGINPSAYIRIPFTLANPADVVSMTLKLHFEDGVVAYLNGHKIVSESAPASPLFNSTASDNSNNEVRPGDAMREFDIAFSGKLASGENMLSFQMLNRTVGSSDVLLIPELSAEVQELPQSTLNGYMLEPTPGMQNSPIEFTGLVDDTTFNIDRGFFDTPFEVTVSCTTPGATIAYTLDGSSPSTDNGNQVPAADADSPPSVTLTISTTTVLRALAFKGGFRTSNVDTQTYLFLDDILNQPANPPGYPLPWVQRNGGTIGGDYDMDQNVVGQIYSRGELKDSLQAIPTISIVTDIANLFDQQTGIQVNPRDAGEASERRVSVEMIGFKDANPVQLDAGMRMNGNASRSPTRPKHNFRLIFRNDYGTGRLDYPLFGRDAPTERFNAIILRGGNGNSWIHPSSSVNTYAMYIRDQWFRDAHSAMGYPEALQGEVHVYFNGLYWGMHHLFERIEEEWSAERFGGEQEDWEGFRIVGGNNIEVINGTEAEVSARMLNTWRSTLDAALAGDLEGVQQYLDLDSFIDYLLLNFHAGNNDWDQNNVRAMRQINPPGKYMFFCHDAERAGFNALSSINININVTGKNTARGPTSINTALRTNPEYAMRFADRAYRHMFNGGALTPENGAAQWAARAEGIRDALKAESARWGDFHSEPPRTLVQWQNALDREYDQWFPFRTPVTIGQLRAIGLYPDIDPPLFNRHGGRVPEGFQLIMTADAGNIYYTSDGSDPRLPGGEINPGALIVPGAVLESAALEAASPGWRYLDDGSDLGTTWTDPGFDDSTWETGIAPLGFGIINGHPFGGPPINPERHLTIYFRRELEMSEPGSIIDATALIMSDGGAILYLNGTEVARDNMPAGTITFNTAAIDDSSGTEGSFETFPIPPSLFVEGTNTIAVEVHNGSAASGDMGMDLQILTTSPNPDHSAALINATQTIKARTFNGSQWSALREVTFITNVPASTDNLVISEIFYNPAGQEEASEYIELMNTSSVTISLAGVSFTGGISHTFADDVTLEPGERLLLVSDIAAFEVVFGTGLPVAGSYGGQLDNGGENLTLSAADDHEIQSLRYNDRAPWPLRPDNEGTSLTLIAPGTNPDASDPENWRSSILPGGTPGTSDALPFNGATAEDLLAYILPNPLAGISPSIDSIEVNGSSALYLVASASQYLAADDAVIEVQFSPDLKSWQSDSAVFLGSFSQADNTTRKSWRALLPLSDNEPLRYARLVVRPRD